MKVLITGGAGFIGSNVADSYISLGHEVVIIDNLITGRRENVDAAIPFYAHDCGDREKMSAIFDEHNIDVVMHFAASALVGESVTEPALYFKNNVTVTQNLLEVMRAQECRKFILSSTAATFGEPDYVPIDEAHPQNPVNPYGLTKLIDEQMLFWYFQAYGLSYNIFRYFNAAGATEKHGEIRETETHIIPLLIEAAEGKRSFVMFGNDFPTTDGTCVRDYIHVADLAAAHILGINNLEKNPSGHYNLGNGNGFSNLDVVDAVKRVSGKAFEFKYGPRRQGDPATLVASAEKAKKELGWEPQFTDLEEIVASAYRFYKRNVGERPKTN